ncbi:phage tail protein [Desulforhopalus singaporensis]|uniref:Prophage minor tail protein Z (GPZ) n=1 Tax=Desulforhopalus singaporensis TaxID=91360 RepID=A0A1H0UV84_9BACT|nr:phage tail protein [Desulforhopalus singaporensis]SDP69696.1 Prophage minor tail protein Z (GPZ) [Desulforhopalus singaporensis]
MITFHGDIDELRRLTKGIAAAEPALEKATVSALNKSIVSTRAYGVKLVARDYAVTQKAVRKELKIYRANLHRKQASIVGSGSPGIPLYQFRPTPRRVPSTKRLKSGGYSPKEGIKVMIRRGSRKVVKGAFIAETESGHIGVFKRRERGLGNWWNAFRKNRIEKMFGPSPLRILDSEHYYEKLDNYTEEIMDKNMAHEADYFLKKAGVIFNV